MVICNSLLPGYYHDLAWATHRQISFPHSYPSCFPVWFVSFYSYGRRNSMPAGKPLLTVRSLLFLQSQVPPGRTCSLFRVLFTFQYLKDIQPDILMNGGC